MDQEEGIVIYEDIKGIASKMNISVPLDLEVSLEEFKVKLNKMMEDFNSNNDYGGVHDTENDIEAYYFYQK